MSRVIECAHVCFSYNAEEVLHNVTFNIEEHAMVAVVGPNGGGKTTLLRLLLGLSVPDRGTVKVFGADPRRVRHRIGYVPQQVLFDPKFPVSAFDVVRMGRVERHRLGPYRKADGDAALAALEQVDMVDRRRRAFSELSGGERQRVLIAQALVSEPDLLLMDEPTANVDSLVEQKLFALFRRLNERRTLICVSHNVNVVTRHVTHVLCVNRSAGMHPMAEVMSTAFRESHGGELALLLHDIHCHVLDSSRVMDAPHTGESL